MKKHFVFNFLMHELKNEEKFKKMELIFTFENVLHIIDGMKEIIQIKKMVMTVLRLLV